MNHYGYCDKYFANINRHKCLAKEKELQSQYIGTLKKEQEELQIEIVNFEKKYPRIMNMINDMREEIDRLQREKHNDKSWDD